MTRYQVYTDGGARPNPGPGGWGAVLLTADGRRRELSGGERHTTNNRMELTAAISALEAIAEGASVELYTDSRYLRQGITTWLPNWVRRNWQRAGDAGAVKNVDLWKRLESARRRHRVRWHWLKGHAGHEHNERADQLATREIEKLGGGGSSARDAPMPGEAAASGSIEAHIKVSCRAGHGAWTALVIEGEDETALGARGTKTSANRLELEAGLAVLRHVARGRAITLFAGDYLRKGATEWLGGWKNRGWTTSTGDPVRNADLWQRIDRELAGRRIRWAPPIKSGPLAKALTNHLKRSAP